MDRGRYEGYVAARDAVALEAPDPLAVEVLDDLAEGLLLARDDGEAEAARDRVPEALGGLVDRGALTRRGATHVWVLLKACGPDMNWPSSWERSRASSSVRAVRGR
jgi:hypothetical protein